MPSIHFSALCAVKPSDYWSQCLSCYFNISAVCIYTFSCMLAQPDSVTLTRFQSKCHVNFNRICRQSAKEDATTVMPMLRLLFVVHIISTSARHKKYFYVFSFFMPKFKVHIQTGAWKHNACANVSPIASWIQLPGK